MEQRQTYDVISTVIFDVRSKRQRCFQILITLPFRSVQISKLDSNVKQTRE